MILAERQQSCHPGHLVKQTTKMELKFLLCEEIEIIHARLPTCTSNSETKSQANSQEKQPTNPTSSDPPSAKVTMEEWMGCGSMEETHIKVDTGHIMSGKWSGVTGLGLSL